jgi:cold shock protein
LVRRRSSEIPLGGGVANLFLISTNKSTKGLRVKMTTGTVKSWLRSYGFIALSTPSSGGKDVFVHISAVERAGLKTLEPDQAVEFQIEVDPKTGRTCAEKLRLL